MHVCVALNMHCAMAQYRLNLMCIHLYTLIASL